jgi:BirA family transcriptional regulator, biotin operon repressor / biotin---[acetyl-CoA-carboxylase] ligase
MLALNESSVNELSGWADVLEQTIAQNNVRIIDRVMVVRKTGTTQDLAALMAGSRPGLLLIAGQQSKGRGRLGRVWLDRQGQGLAATFALDADLFDRPSLPIAAGLAVCQAIEPSLVSGVRVGLRWPNDLVEWLPDQKPGRKIAGVLIERRGPLMLVGVGINVSQNDPDWPEELASKAVSLAQLGSTVDRLNVAQNVLKQLDRTLHQPADTLAREWQSRNVLHRRRTAWHVNGPGGPQRLEGTIEHIDPASQITLKLDSGPSITLSTATASLLSVDAIEHQSL